MTELLRTEGGPLLTAESVGLLLDHRRYLGCTMSSLTIREHLAKIEAAVRLATLDAARTLDVDRLARALHVVDDDVQFMHRDAAGHRDVIATRIAREYAALPEEGA